MGYHHYYLRPVSDLEKELDEIGIETFVKKYSKYPVIGETDRVNYINKIKQQWHTINSDGGQKEKNTNH
jgi:hypothetical protein